jgi:thiol:disulfide interchange protein
MTVSKSVIRKVASFSLLAGAAIAVLASFKPNTWNETFSEGAGKIEFQEENWEAVLAKAKKENKLIFVDLYATWCAPCKMMKVQTFGNQEVADLFNGKFINVALNGEKGKGLELMEKYNLRAYPSLLFINSEDKVVVHTEGFHNPTQLIYLGQQVLAISE